MCGLRAPRSFSPGRSGKFNRNNSYFSIFSGSITFMRSLLRAEQGVPSPPPPPPFIFFFNFIFFLCSQSPSPGRSPPCPAHLFTRSFAGGRSLAHQTGTCSGSRANAPKNSFHQSHARWLGHRQDQQKDALNPCRTWRPSFGLEGSTSPCFGGCDRRLLEMPAMLLETLSPVK